jgi:WD40 repeat protein
MNLLRQLKKVTLLLLTFALLTANAGAMCCGGDDDKVIQLTSIPEPRKTSVTRSTMRVESNGEAVDRMRRWSLTTDMTHAAGAENWFDPAIRKALPEELCGYLPKDIIDLICTYATITTCVFSARNGQHEITCLLELPKNQLAVTSLGINDITIWDTNKQEPIRYLDGHSRQPTALAFLPITEQLASASLDMSIRIWNMPSGNCSQILNGHDQRITHLLACPKGLLASGSRDSSVKIWDPVSGYCVKTVTLPHGGISCLIPLSDGRIATASLRRGCIKIIDLRTGNITNLSGHDEQGVTCIVETAKNRMASSSWDGSVKLWDLQRNTCIQTTSKKTYNATTGIDEKESISNLIPLMNNKFLPSTGAYEILGKLPSGLIVLRHHKKDGGTTLNLLSPKTKTCVTIIEPRASITCFIQLQLKNPNHIVIGTSDGTIQTWKINETD